MRLASKIAVVALAATAAGSFASGANAAGKEDPVSDVRQAKGCGIGALVGIPLGAVGGALYAKDYRHGQTMYGVVAAFGAFFPACFLGMAAGAGYHRYKTP